MNFYFTKYNAGKNQLMRRDYLELSKLSYDILPEFYNCFKCSKKKMLKIIINLFKKPN